MKNKLSESFFQSHDIVSISRKLLGSRLWTRTDGTITAGIIVETEAYDGLIDRASHAFGGKRTSRTNIFYHPGGVAYTYLCYGIHTLFNIITGPEEIPHAVLIRAIAPNYGINKILERRNQTRLKRNTAAGPGLVCKALGITTAHNGIPIDGDIIWLTPGGPDEIPKDRDITASPRVGVGYAGKDATRPWRFRIKSSRWTSPAK